MAERSVESSMRKAEKIGATLDQNLSTSDLNSVSPHQRIDRAGNIGYSPHFKPKLSASITASPYKYVAPDKDRYKILDSSFDVVHEKSLH